MQSADLFTRPGHTLRPPNMCGKEEGNEGAAWMAGKEILPMLSSGVRPKIPRIWLKVTHLHGRRDMFSFSLVICTIWGSQAGQS